jgi:lipoprotein-anchoring transpeptidase ErfK/SrfK
VDAATWRKLQDPLKPKPRHKKPRMHIEIDQTRQLVFVVKRGKVRWILHTSTGAGGATRDGAWRVHRRLAGYSGNRLYYPSYFDGLRAIHGWPEVPTYNASHGCSRVPMWAATWIYGKADIGTRVFVYH